MTQQELLKVIDQAVENNLSSVDLSNKSLASLPPQVAKLAKITSLDLSRNQLTQIPKEVAEMGLEFHWEYDWQKQGIFCANNPWQSPPSDIIRQGRAAVLAWFAEQEQKTPVASVASDSTAQSLRVFLCHASQNKPQVRELYQRLLAAGYDPWLDDEKLLPGQNWREEIEKAVEQSDVIIVCLSHAAVIKEGFVQREMRLALDVADEKPEDTISIIPLKLEECEVPRRLRRKQWVAYFEESGFNRLVLALQARAQQLGL